MEIVKIKKSCNHFILQNVCQKKKNCFKFFFKRTHVHSQHCQLNLVLKKTCNHFILQNVCQKKKLVLDFFLKGHMSLPKLSIDSCFIV